MVLTIDREFLIYLPLPADYKNEVKKKITAHAHTNLTLNIPIFRLTSPQEDECGNIEKDVSFQRAPKCFGGNCPTPPSTHRGEGTEFRVGSEGCFLSRSSSRLLQAPK